MVCAQLFVVWFCGQFIVYYTGKPVDMWSMGVILYMLLGGYPPFYEPDDDQKAMFRKILSASYQFHADTWDVVSDEAKDMIRGLLTLDPERRLTVDQCLAHPWLSKPRSELVVRDLNRNMLVLKNFRTARVLQVGAAGANIAIDVIRHLSGANLSKGYTVNDAAIDVLRKISGANLNDIAVDAARKRSAANLFKSTSPPASNKI
jgi:serine/threonine protein kinase